MTADGVAPGLKAARGERALVGLLVSVAALAWWWTATGLRGMDAGPWTSLGGFGWFVGVWIVMMSAMMLPSAIPTVALYAGMLRTRSLLRPLLFASGYLSVWGAGGIAAFAVASAGRHVAGGDLAWSASGRWVAGATVLAAALYQLSPLKDRCLGRCRNPLAFLLGSWRLGPIGAVRMGAVNGLWCAGCCWALMASLLVLGAMSVSWMALVAALVGLEKALPWRRTAIWSTAVVLLALGSLLLAGTSA